MRGNQTGFWLEWFVFITSSSLRPILQYRYTFHRPTMSVILTWKWDLTQLIVQFFGTASHWTVYQRNLFHLSNFCIRIDEAELVLTVISYLNSSREVIFVIVYPFHFFFLTYSLWWLWRRVYRHVRMVKFSVPVYMVDVSLYIAVRFRCLLKDISKRSVDEIINNFWKLSSRIGWWSLNWTIRSFLKRSCKAMTGGSERCGAMPQSVGFLHAQCFFVWLFNSLFCGRSLNIPLM